MTNHCRRDKEFVANNHRNQIRNDIAGILMTGNFLGSAVVNLARPRPHWQRCRNCKRCGMQNGFVSGYASTAREGLGTCSDGHEKCRDSHGTCRDSRLGCPASEASLPLTSECLVAGYALYRNCRMINCASRDCRKKSERVQHRGRAALQRCLKRQKQNGL